MRLAGGAYKNLALAAGDLRLNALAVLQYLRCLALNNRLIAAVLDQLVGQIGVVDLEGVVADLRVEDVAAGDLVRAELLVLALAPYGVLPVSIAGDLEALCAVSVAESGELESNLPVAGLAVELHGVECPAVGGAGVVHCVMGRLDVRLTDKSLRVPGLIGSALRVALAVDELLGALAGYRIILGQAVCRSCLVVRDVKDVGSALAYRNIAAGSLVVAEGAAAALAEYLALPVTLSGDLEALSSVRVALAGEINLGGPLILVGIVVHLGEGPAVGGACVVELSKILLMRSRTAAGY